MRSLCHSRLVAPCRGGDVGGSSGVAWTHDDDVMADLHDKTIGQAIAEEQTGVSAPAQDNLEVIANLADEETAKVGALRARIERISSVFSTPGYFLFALTFIVVWILVNVWGLTHGWKHVDEPPFFWLQGLVSSNALLLTVSVLIRQDRTSQAATHHAHLDLQINLLTERKVAKLLELVAKIERDRSAEHRDHDEQIAELSKPTDAGALMGAIKRGADEPSAR